MAFADYRLCDVCERKAFYDAELGYEVGKFGPEDKPPFKVAGEPQMSSPELSQQCGARLGYLGDWAVLCSSCAKTHRTQIVPIEDTGAAS